MSSPKNSGPPPYIVGDRWFELRVIVRVRFRARVSTRIRARVSARVRARVSVRVRARVRVRRAGPGEIRDKWEFILMLNLI